MTANIPEKPSDSASSSPRGVDPLAIGTLVAVLAMVAFSFWNVLNTNRLAARVAALETVLNAARQPAGPDPAKVHPVNTVGAQAKGPDRAPVTIVEFSDFQCPFCARVVPTLEQIEDTYKGSVRIVWKHLPLPIHKEAVGAAVAAEAAGKQGKFWEFHDMLFADQAKLGADDLKQHAQTLQLDMSRFEADLLNADEQKKIDTDVAEAKALGIMGTPGIFINGRFVAGAQPFEVFAKVIDEELEKQHLPVPAKPSAN